MTAEIKEDIAGKMRRVQLPIFTEEGTKSRRM